MSFVAPFDANFFNLTMSYRLDADIVWPYGEVRTLETDQFTAPMIDPKWRDTVMEFSGILGKRAQPGPKISV